MVLVDTNILVRVLQPHHPLYPIANLAVQRLGESGLDLHVVPQNMVELWVVVTRPLMQNGLAMSSSQAKDQLLMIATMFDLLPDSPDIYDEWERLVTTYRVVGKPAHDARLVAAMRVHGLDTVLTFDTSGFSRYPGIKVLHPADVDLA